MPPSRGFGDKICGYSEQLAVKKPSAEAEDAGRLRFSPQVGKMPWRRTWQPTPVFLPGESHGQGSLAGYSPGGQKQSDTIEQPSTHPQTLNVSESKVLKLFSLGLQALV